MRSDGYEVWMPHSYTPLLGIRVSSRTLGKDILLEEWTVGAHNNTDSCVHMIIIITTVGLVRYMDTHMDKLRKRGRAPEKHTTQQLNTFIAIALQYFLKNCGPFMCE